MDQQQQQNQNDIVPSSNAGNIYNLKEGSQPDADLAQSDDVDKVEEGKTKPRPATTRTLNGDQDASMQPDGEKTSSNEE